MIINYIKIGLRNLFRNKLHSIINLIGLSIGLACVILMLVLVQHELSYDKFNKNFENIYRIYVNNESNTYFGSSSFAVTPAPLSIALEEEYPQVLNTARIRAKRPILAYENKVFNDQIVYYTDPGFFKIFDYKLIKGNTETSLVSPYSIILSEKTAQKFFGNDDAIGKTIKNDNDFDLTVTGIMENVPSNSHLDFDCLVSFSTLGAVSKEGYLDSWNQLSYTTYVHLREGTSQTEFEEKLEDLHQKYRGAAENKEEKFLAKKLGEIHLHSNINFDIATTFKPKILYIFSSIAIFVLLIACFNYMNLSTARSSNRSREIAVRKVVGGRKSQLAWQFMVESFMLIFIATNIAMIFVERFLPVLNKLLYKKIDINYFDLKIIVPVILIIIITGFISGSYPAIYLSSLKPVKILKANFKQKSGTGKLLRNSLVVIQFIIIITFIISAISINRQLNFVKNSDLGFEKENILILKRNPQLQENYTAFENEIKNSTLFIDYSGSERIPVNISSSNYGWWEGKEAEKDYEFMLSYNFVDYKFIDFYGIEILKGRNFIEGRTSDIELGYIINEAAAREIGWEDPIGKKIKLWSDSETAEVIGVIKDFHFYPMRLSISPLVFRIQTDLDGYISLKIKPGDNDRAVEFLENLRKVYSPDFPLSYSFMEDRINTLYRQENNFAEIINYFTIIALFLACIGLLGLSSYIVEQKTKEIGIRKVLGAKVSGLSLLLSFEFVKWVLLAVIAAWPLGWLFMKNWLKSFSYKTELSIWIFILASVLALFIAILTTSIQTIKAARKNPVDSLRYE